MASRSADRLIRRNLKILRGDNISAIRSRRHDTASRIENDVSFKDTKLAEFLSRKKLRRGGPEAGLLLRKTVPAMASPSLNYLVMQYLFHTKNQFSFDPIKALSHFIVPRSAESSSSKEPLMVKEQGKRGQGDDAMSKGKVTASSGIGSSGFTNHRLEILKMRAARRPTDVGSRDDLQSEQGMPDQ